MAHAVITLITDFGLADPYVGQMKGVMLLHHAGCSIIDISHQIPPQNILAAARALLASYCYFPAKTVHVVVVDPGVGSQRAILAASGSGHSFVAPDNGILSPLIRQGIIEKIHRLAVLPQRSSSISPTFHGRDIIAPAAALLAQGMELPSLGPAVAPDHCVQLDLPRATRDGDRLLGEVTHIDHFGNLQTSISRQLLSEMPAEAILSIQIADQEIVGLSRSYSDAHKGSLLALVDSTGYLEIAVNCGNASHVISCALGTHVFIKASLFHNLPPNNPQEES